MDTIDPLCRIVEQSSVPPMLKERIVTAFNRLLVVGRDYGGYLPPERIISPEEAAAVMLALYQAAPLECPPNQMKVVYADYGQDFNFSLSREIGRLFRDLMHEYSETRQAIWLHGCLAPQVVVNARTFLVHRTDIGHVFATTAAKNVWSALFLLTACLHQDWMTGLKASLPLVEMMSVTIPVYYCRQQSTWLMRRLA